MPGPDINCNLSPNEQWKDGINKAYESVKASAQECAKNKSGGCKVNAWNKWDEEIKTTVNAFNRYLANTPNYRNLDWRYIKAILWTESGAKHKAWDSRPMQFGNIGDQGKGDLLSPDPIKKQEYELIVPKNYRKNIDTGAHNIHLGIAYLLKRLANFGFKSKLDDNDKTIYSIKVKPGDSLDKIAKANKTTVEILKNMNPGLVPQNLKIGMELKYRKGAIKRVITGWKEISTMSIAMYYNGNGDKFYCAKLNYVLKFI
ncbi:LysM peptidoglycan-binding domain-containing protein [Snodgrassella alvi]|uniref:LysM peptidoglycan-binding domain-containing protein n=1 Tax=Snodgrassella alvi TaxID=1196083 RepID=UPI0009FD9836|nr:LysM domain-containing protein [Snodgrassella alvi]ORF09391.1 hypothetical protein BGH96_00170 [Snodgrassella alvi]